MNPRFKSPGKSELKQQQLGSKQTAFLRPNIPRFAILAKICNLPTFYARLRPHRVKPGKIKRETTLYGTLEAPLQALKLCTNQKWPCGRRACRTTSSTCRMTSAPFSQRQAPMLGFLGLQVAAQLYIDPLNWYLASTITGISWYTPKDQYSLIF